MRESIKIWRRLSKQEPVYRNQNELSAWIEASGEVTKYLSRTYENASPDECYEAISRLERFYVIPAINKVYGVQLRDEIDLNRWVHSKTAKDGYFESEQEPSWSLKAPEKAEEFWDWFEDDKTGKPVVRNQDGAESGLTEQSMDSDSQLQALARETSPPEKKKQLRRKRKEIIESEQEKRS